MQYQPNLGTVYLIHFEEPYEHARHYMGWSSDLSSRLDAHSRGTGARLLEVINEVGIDYKVVRLWPDQDRHFERRLKNQKNAPRLCPVCRGEVTYAEVQDFVGRPGVGAERPSGG